MDYYLSAVSVASIIIAAILSRFITQRIMQVADRTFNRKTSLLLTPAGSAILFATIFVVLWCAVGFLLFIPWLLATS